MKLDLYNVITGELIPADAILAALKEIFAYIVDFIKGEI